MNIDCKIVERNLICDANKEIREKIEKWIVNNIDKVSGSKLFTVSMFAYNNEIENCRILYSFERKIHRITKYHSKRLQLCQLVNIFCAIKKR